MRAFDRDRAGYRFYESTNAREPESEPLIRESYSRIKDLLVAIARNSRAVVVDVYATHRPRAPT